CAARTANASTRCATTSPSCCPRKQSSRADRRPPAFPDEARDPRGKALKLDRLQLGLMAAVGATRLVSIFAAQTLLTLALVVFAARIGLRQARFPRLSLDGPTLAFSVW